MKTVFTSFLLLFFISVYSQCESVATDRSGWSIHSFSSEEPTGEGTNNGRAIHAIDNNINTFWHSRWQNYTNEFPHYLTIDMGQNHDLNGLEVTSRNMNFF